MPVPDYRLCAIDLDETLLGPDHLISERNARAIAAVCERGVFVVIASGRMHEATLRFVDQLRLQTPVVSYNGAMVKTPHTGEVLLHEKVQAELATEVMDYAAENGLQFNYYLDDHFYSQAMTPWAELYVHRTLAPIEIRPDLYTTLRGTEPTKMIIIDTPEKTNSLLPIFRERFGDMLYVTKSTDEYLEFMPANASKGAALERVAERLGVTAAQSIAFGDSFNDIPMIQWAGLGIAVANAKPAVLSAAHKTCLSNAEEGVGVALEEIFNL